MGDNSQYLTVYKQFFSRFSSSVDPSDQLPVKVAGYNLSEFEIVGAVTDWCLQYLNQRQCPSSLIAPLIQTVVKEVHQTCSIDPKAYRSKENDFLPLQLMQLTMRKLVEVCCQYNDNAMLSTLPPPYSGLSAPKVSSCAIKNSRRSMEDRHVVLQDLHALFNIKDCGSASYYAVFDGHNGLDAAVYGVSHLHQFLAESQYYPTDPVLAFKDAFKKTDEQFIHKSGKENLRSGTTAVCALLRPKESMLYIAWLGDSQAVIVKQGCPTQIVKPHKPDREDERERIEGMGGSVLFWGTWRVNGQLAVSRAIGDLEYKPYVSAEPDVKAIPLDGTEDFLIVACDGLWDFVSEQEAVNAVYNQLNMSPDDLEGVSQRLVGLSKDQGSADNISVVVVFLAEPTEVARRRHMETASPNPFLKQNGSELFCGTPANGKLHPCSGSFHDEDDFGPETDVDMVDDVLLSPTIAAAKKLVAEKSEFEDDLERQRHQMSDFDDPADVDRSRDTPTPPAHEVVGNVDDNIAAESGEGEDSEEEEWNYFCGSTQNNKDTSVNPESQDPDMTSQLNPNAAEFVPVSPSRFMMDPDPVISSSPMHGYEKSLDNVPLPSQVEFNLDIAHRPGQLNSSGTEGQLWSENVTGYEDTRVGKNEQISTNAECGDDSALLSFGASANNSTELLFGEVSRDVTQNELDSLNNKSMEHISTFESKNMNIDSLKDLGTYSSNTEVKGFHQSTEAEELDVSKVPETPKSTAVEAPVSPIDLETDIDSPDDNQHNQKSPELISPSDGHLEGFSVQEPTSSSGFESESGADEPEIHISDDLKQNVGDGFTVEHRKSPPVQPVNFKPIHTFGDTNPFGVLDNLTSPSTEKEITLTETSDDMLKIENYTKTTDGFVDNKTELLVDKDNNFQDDPTYCNLMSPKESFLPETSLSLELHGSSEKQEHPLISVISDTQGIDESKKLEKIVSQSDDLICQSLFSNDTTGTKLTDVTFGNSVCSFESKGTELEISEFKESKVAAGHEQSEMGDDLKAKGNIFNTITGLEFETSKQEFDDKVSDIIFGSRDTELAFDSGKSCEIESVINSSVHQVHNFEEVEFDTSKSNKLESKCLDIHFGTDDIEFETDYNDYSLTNRSENISVPCKEENENIGEEHKLVDNIVKRDVDDETSKAQINSNIEPVQFPVDSISIESNSVTQNVEITESALEYITDSVVPSSEECIETSVSPLETFFVTKDIDNSLKSSTLEELLNQSENSVTELYEDQIASRNITTAYDFGKNVPNLLHTLQDVQEKAETEINETIDDKQLEEIHKDISLVEREKEICNIIEKEICSDIKEVEVTTISATQPELTQSPLTVIVGDKVEEPLSSKTETNISVNLVNVTDVTAFETAAKAGAELEQSVITETETMLQTFRGEKVITSDELSGTVQYDSSFIMDRMNNVKVDEKIAEPVSDLIPPTKIETAVESIKSTEVCEPNVPTELEESSKLTLVDVQSESLTQKLTNFEDLTSTVNELVIPTLTSTVNEVVIPTLSETCVMPVTEQEFPQVSSDKLLNPVSETQPTPQSETVEQIPQVEEAGEIPSVTETPPPTPAPGIVDEKDDKKEGLLAAAVAAAGVATVAAAVASDSKAAPKKLAGTSKKPVTSASKKPLDVGTKTAAKPSLKTVGSPSKPATSKPSPQPAITKKPSTTAASKTTKPAGPDVKTVAPTTLKSATKPSTPTSRTAITNSKPSTPLSKPATPTSRPASANKADTSKSSLTKPTPPAKTTAAKPTKPAVSTIKVTEKKPLTNGELPKPAAKKTDSETKKLPPSAASKPASTVGRPSSVAAKPAVTKLSPTATKPAVAAKTSTTAPAVQSKPKPAAVGTVKQTTKPNISTTVAKSRPPSASTTLKLTDKTGKDTVNKQISSVKSSTLSKVLPGNKTTLKTDTKVASKVDSTKLKSKDQVKKSTGTRNQEPTQEHTVTTTNGYTDIIENGVKKQEPTLVDNSNQDAVKAVE